MTQGIVCINCYRKFTNVNKKAHAHYTNVKASDISRGRTTSAFDKSSAFRL